MVRITDGNMH